MNPKCSSCARFKKADSFPTCKACRGLAADRVLGCDKHGLKLEPPAKKVLVADKPLKWADVYGIDPNFTDSDVERVRAVADFERSSEVDERPVDPFVAAGHDLQPRRRFPWRKRR